MQEPLYEQIYRQVYAEIEAGRLRPGDRVPSEKELADRYQVSRITSKKALEKLAQAGIIARARGKGSFVNHAPAAPVAVATPDGTPAQPNTLHQVVGFLLPDFSGTFGERMVRAVERQLREYNKRMILCRTEGQRELEDRAIDSCLALGVGGLIVFPVYGDYHNERIIRLVLNRFPVVVVDRSLKGISVCTVATDHRQAAADLTRHLIELGHRRIAFFTPPPAGTSSIEDRLQGVTATMAAHGLPFTPDDFVQLYCTVSGAYAPHAADVARDEVAVRIYLQSHPDVTAIITCEHTLAMIARHVLIQLGKRIPEDYSIATFDTGHLEYIEPHLTHIAQDETAIGSLAVELLLSQIAGNEAPLRTSTPHQLRIGTSTGGARTS
ncbi:MAG: GntR family transcriptional regulator [Anaerolineales bacterium]|nr:GntR family transcriptional regulator [Anaerolineales bacterium]